MENYDNDDKIINEPRNLFYLQKTVDKGNKGGIIKKLSKDRAQKT